MVYPNPAEDQLTIERVSSADTASAKAAIGVQTTLSSEAVAAPFSIELYNDRQEIVVKDETTRKSKNRKIQLDTRKFPSGTYYLHIIHQEGVEERKVVIE